MFQPSRDEARRFLATSWQKYGAGAPLTALERIAVGLVALHPEFHPLLADPERHLGRDWAPEGGETNPFLHLSLHLAVAEQLAIDQPAGIAAEFDRLRAAHRDEHAALHVVIDCLGEILWQAQRQHLPPDGAAYLACLRRQ